MANSMPNEGLRFNGSESFELMILDYTLRKKVQKLSPFEKPQ